MREPEEMDDPALAPEEHHRALVALARVNRVSGTAGRIIRRLDGLADDRVIRVLDVGCGGGDVAIRIARWAKSRGRDVRVVGLDRSAVALEHAREAAELAQVRVDLVRADAVGGFPEGPWDLVVVNLFLHHLADEQVVELLEAVAGNAEALLAQDLARGRIGYLLAWFGMRLLSRSRVGHVDGPLSVRAGFRSDELLALAHLAGMRSARIETSWPARLILSWSQEPK